MSKKMLNLGCGTHFHKDWTNVDFTSSCEEVIAHNLIQGIPFEDSSFDVVYHSHVLEHFSKKDANTFIQECWRLLKPNGILRVAVPDLEQIARIYLRSLQEAYEGSKPAKNDYDWIMLEMYDQTVRNTPGGLMLEYFQQDSIPNMEFVQDRLGNEALKIREACTAIKQNSSNNPSKPVKKKNKIKNIINRIIKKNNKEKFSEEDLKHIAIGKFRLGGEIHQWMYDKYSLSCLLQTNGFNNITLTSAYDSMIIDWQEYGLDIIDGAIRKPDSLFMEAVK